MEERHENDTRRLWMRMAALTAIVCSLTRGGEVLSFLMEVLI